MERKILIVEDERETLNFLKENLERLNFSIAAASGGKEAIEKIKQFKPGLVILDIILPDLDGLDILRWIKENHLDLYVILATGKKDVEDLKKGYNLQADYYITKPYTIEEILQGINVLFSLKEEPA